MNEKTLNIVDVAYESDGSSTKVDSYGMREMQKRAFAKRNSQHLLIKAPPASGKSRALMFLALDKLTNQDKKKVIIAVPERSIGASFADTDLTEHGFFADWHIDDRNNLTNDDGLEDKGKVPAFMRFMDSDDQILLCTHATLRFAFENVPAKKFNDCVLAIDEFHHTSTSESSKLGQLLHDVMNGSNVQIIAMTGSYFRGDAVPILTAEDEAEFDKVTYTYYEQLNGYTYLKTLGIGYHFYTGSYLDDGALSEVLDTHKKTIVHIPNVNSKESTLVGKLEEVQRIYDLIGTWVRKDADSNLDIIATDDGRELKVANLVNDEKIHRDKLARYLSEEARENIDAVDIIIALGMAKEGFDWPYCEHALTIGYRSSLTEIVQIIGRATRDAPGKTRARFTNLIAEPDADSQLVTEAVNDTLKAIAASLLMEQVLSPRFEFRAKRLGNTADAGYDYGENGYDPNGTNVGFNPETGCIQIEIAGLKEPQSQEASRICQEDLNELIASFVQDKVALERGLFDQEETVPEELTQVRMGKIIKEKYPELDEADQEAVRQHAVAALNVVQQARAAAHAAGEPAADGAEGAPVLNTAFVEGVRKFAMNVKELDIDLIDSINPFGQAYAILAKSMSESSLKAVADVIASKKTPLSMEDARELSRRALQFKTERGRLPSATSQDPWERKLAEAVAFLAQKKAEAARGK